MRYLDKQGITRAGPPMTIYIPSSTTLNFTYQAAVPITAPPKDLPKGDIRIGQSPGRQGAEVRLSSGSYDAMEDIYEPIAVLSRREADRAVGHP